MLSGNRLHPYRLPDAAYGSIPDTFRITDLLSTRLRSFVRRVPNLYNQLIGTFGGKGGSNASSDAGGPEEGEEDEMLMPAIECVVEAGMASTSLLQRRLKLGYARAARIVDEMETRGIVGPFEGSKPRQVLITPERWAEMKLSQDN